MKMKQDTDIGRYIVGFRVFKDENGNFSYDFREWNTNNVPHELIIMQLNVFLRDLKDNYQNKYTKKS